jgi:CO/xanthine dehydrogenase FAD-binding subunit
LASEKSAPLEPEARGLLFVHRLKELRQLEQDGDLLRIGAGLSYSELLANAHTPAILRAAVASIAAPAVRNAGTIGGNIANASPKGDAALACFVTDCALRLASVRGERVVPIAEFYRGRGRTTREPDELLLEILMPTRWANESVWAFEKVGGRKALAIARVSFAGLLAIKDNTLVRLATAFGAIEDRVVRRPDIDARLVGLSLAEARAQLPGWLTDVSEALQPIEGRVSAAYRKQVCLNVLGDFMERNL